MPEDGPLELGTSSGTLAGLSTAQKRTVMKQRRQHRPSISRSFELQGRISVTITLKRTSNDMQGMPIATLQWVEATKSILAVTKGSRLAMYDSALLTVEKQLLGCK